MKYRIYFDAEEVINGIKDFDTVEELLDFIAEYSWDIKDDYLSYKSKVNENDYFKIHYISEIDEKIITLKEPIRVAIEIGKKRAEEKARDLDKKNEKELEDSQRATFEKLKKKFEGS